MDTQWSRPTKRMVAVGLVVLFVFLVILARPVWPALILAGLIAFILSPLIGLVQRRMRAPRPAAILIVYLLFVLLVVLAPAVFVPAIAASLTALDINFVEITSNARDGLVALLESWREVTLFGSRLDLSAVVNPALDALLEARIENLIPSVEQILGALPTTLELTASVFGVLLTVVASAFFTFMLSIYMSLDGPRLRRGVMGYVPEAYRPELQMLLSRIQRIWNAFIRGQLTLSFVIFVVVLITTSMIGLPGSFALAAVAGVLELVPNIGPVLAAVPAVVIALIQGSTVLEVSNLTFALIVLALYTLIQQLENQLLVPRILGGAVELPSVVVLAAVLIGASVFGVLGALLAAPVVASGRLVVAYALNKMLDREPFAAEPATVPRVPGAASLRELWERIVAAWERAF
ncbi:MAG: AI-2E family transporter [Candidatus Promineifilaceae bacterium]